MQVLVNIPDKYAREFLDKFVPSGTIDTEWIGRGEYRDMQIPLEIEQVFTDGRNHRESWD